MTQVATEKSEPNGPSLQEIFDKTVRHLFKQGKRSVNYSGFCLYRGDGGTRCAVGAHIPDEVYAPELEGANIGGLSHARQACYAHRHEAAIKLPAWLFGESNIALLKSLQIAHDIEKHWLDEETMRDKLRRTGENFGISLTILDRPLKFGVDPCAEIETGNFQQACS